MRDSIKAQFEVLDERFRSCGGDGWMERLHTGCRWTEGPAYFPAGRYLVFSDIPNDRILRWDETTGAVGVFRQPAGYANGHTDDRNGRLVSCEQDGLHCFDPDGTLIGKLHVPEVVANFTFGGTKRNRLFICASSSLYSILVNFNGARYPR